MPLRTSREKILDPITYNIDGREICLVSLTVPVFSHGRTIGVIGIDLSVEQCRAIVSRQRPYGTGYMAMISNNGVVVAHPNKGYIGKNIFDLDCKNKYLVEIKEGKPLTVIHNSKYTGDNVYLYFSPIHLSDDDKPWSVVVAAPEKAVLAGVTRARNLAVLIGLLALLIVSSGVYLVAGSVAGPIQKSTQNISLSAESVSSASEQIASSSQQLSSGATEQASALEETSAALEEIASMTGQNADHADQADNYMKDVSVLVKEAESDMEELVKHVARINQTGNETAGIIKTVEEIAFQTNLSALNAARGGCPGRGSRSGFCSGGRRGEKPCSAFCRGR